MQISSTALAMAASLLGCNSSMAMFSGLIIEEKGGLLIFLVSNVKAQMSNRPGFDVD